MPSMPDLAARLARRLSRSAYAPMRWPRLAVMGAMVLVTAICAIWEAGLRHQAEGAGFSWLQLTDYAYAPFLYLVPQSSLAYADALSLPQFIARLVGPLIPLLSLFWLLRQRLFAQLAGLLAARFARGHIVVLGAEGSADALARASSTQGAVIALVDPSLADAADRQEALGGAGVVCLQTVPRSVAKAGAVVVWQGSDVDNIAAAATLRRDCALRVEEIDILVQSAALQNALLQSPDLMLDRAIRLRPHSLSGVAMRAALSTTQMADCAIARQQPCVTLCLWGMSDALLWGAEIALQQFWSIHLAAPRIIWAGLDPDAALPEALARLVRHAEPVFGAGAHCPQVMVLSAEDACRAAEVTCHLVDAGTADATLTQAFALAARLRQEHASPPPVQAILETSCAIEPLFSTDKLVFLPPIIPRADATVSGLRNRAADQRAAEIHLAYDRKFGGSETVPASGRWQDLPETYVAANRAAADHGAIKQWDAAASELEGEALIEALAEAEHRRWSTERLLAGWVPAGESERDNARRLHPDLRPWAELGEEAREKDREAVRAGLADRE